MNPPNSNPWYCLHSASGNAAWNMALDEALLQSAPALTQPVLRFYTWAEPAATFGYFQKISEVENMTMLRPLIRRPTGGGLVPHDADWTYSVIVPPNASWYSFKAVESYQWMHEWIQSAFLALGLRTEIAADCRKPLPGQCFEGHEKFDVLFQGRKIAGAAQRRTRDGLLIQGSVQPPPVNFSRADWERSMMDVAVAKIGAAWSTLEIHLTLQKNAMELSEKNYSQAVYNRRR